MTDEQREEKPGIIKNYFDDRGYGFLENDVFFHVNNVEENLRSHLKSGLKVFYIEIQGSKGIEANLTRAAGELEMIEKFTGEYIVVDPMEILSAKVMEQIRTIILNNGAVLVPGMLNRIPKTFGKIKKNREKEISDKFGKHLVETFETDIVAKYDLFSSKKKPDGTEIIGHPHLQELVPFVWLIRKSNVHLDFRPRNQIPPQLFDFIYARIIEQDNNSWVIVGDETGDAAEFQGKEPENHHTSMGWVVIPPRSALPALPPTFHVTSNEEHMILATNNLLTNEEVRLYQFRYASGETIKGVPSESAQVHLNLWKDTLPLVLNKVSEQSNGTPKVRIYMERVGDLEAGTNPIAGLLANWKLAMGESWVNIDIANVLAKDPLEHPWLGYPDAVGFIHSNRTWKEADLKPKIEHLKSRLIEAPYRQDELGKINGLFMTKQPPVQFVKALFDFTQRDIKEYIVEFYGQELRKRIEVLDERDWYTILEEMEQHSGNLQGQNATSVIFDHTDIEKTLSNLKTKSLKFSFLMALLGCSNHNGDTDRSQFCKINIVELIESEFEPTRQQRMHFLNLSNGANDNEFDFSIDDDEIHSLIEQVKDGFQDDIERKLAGAYAHTLALRDTDDDLSIAWEIEKLLRQDSARDPYNPNHARRLNYKSELLLARNEHVRARNFMEIDIPQELNTSLQQLLREDGFFVAALIKSCALCDEDATKFSVYSSFIPALLDNRHPSQRIAYWTARWAWQVGKENDPVVQQCIDHLIQLTTIEIFTKEAPGLILSCELMDLHALGLLTHDVHEFHNTVIEKSTASTQQWVQQHPPTEEDWLAPLTYNYR